MASLLEITNTPRSVRIRDQDIPVSGITANGLAILMTRFPEFGKILSGVKVDVKELGSLAAPAIAAVIAAGTGHPGDDDHERAAAGLTVGEQTDILDEVLRLTFPRGLGPFVEKLQGLGLLGPAGIPSPETSQPPQNNSSQPGTETP